MIGYNRSGDRVSPGCPDSVCDKVLSLTENDKNTNRNDVVVEKSSQKAFRI